MHTRQASIGPDNTYCREYPLVHRERIVVTNGRPCPCNMYQVPLETKGHGSTDGFLDYNPSHAHNSRLWDLVKALMGPGSRDGCVQHDKLIKAKDQGGSRRIRLI